MKCGFTNLTVESILGCCNNIVDRYNVKISECLDYTRPADFECVFAGTFSECCALCEALAEKNTLLEVWEFEIHPEILLVEFKVDRRKIPQDVDPDQLVLPEVSK